MSATRTYKYLPFFFAVLFMVIMALLGFVIWSWTSTTDFASQALEDASDDAWRVLDKTIQDRAHMLSTVNSSTFNLARVLSSSVNGNLSLFSTIEKQVAPTLFLAYSTIPCLSQVSYIGGDGIFFSYSIQGNQTIAVFSNASWSFSNHSTGYHWYGQVVDGDTGIMYGDATDLTQLAISNSDWINRVLKNNMGDVSLGKDLGKDQNLLFLFTAPVMEGTSTKIQQGSVSIGISASSFLGYVFNLDLRSGGFYVVTKDGRVLSQSGIGFFQTKDVEDVAVSASSDLSCNLSKFSFMTNNPSIGNLQDKRYKFQCTSIDVVGIQLLYVLALPSNGVMHHVHKMIFIALTVLLLMLTLVAFASSFMFQFIRKYQKKETFLHASLIKQKEATVQAERKSMNKSSAFASASHDIRTSLVGITSLVELCRGHVSPDPLMDNNLDQINLCASKLLGILNSVLDISKVEAGKMQLEEIEFDMAQVLEESIDIFHNVALKKGLEVVWDPCDGSVLESLRVKGDCRRFKQILDNLLGNAVKFTSKGHVVVRAWAKPSLQSPTPSSNRGCQVSNLLGPLTQLLCKDDNVHDVPNSIEFIIDVDDAGIGIPKEKRASVFENYVQVKESAYEGHEGTGLGLGIVQSYVRLMGGEISILDKDVNENGTWFRFNIFLKPVETGEEVDISNTDARYSRLNAAKSKNSVVQFSEGLKQNGIHIHVVLFLQGEETRRVTQTWMEKHLGVKLWDVNCIEVFRSTLENVKSGILGHFNAPGKFNLSPSHEECSDPSRPYIYNIGEMEGSSTCMKEGFDHNFFLKRTSSRYSITHTIVVVDICHEPLSEICSTLKFFVKGIHRYQYKIIWLVDSNTSSTKLRRLEQEQVPYDLILRKPFHGSRLYGIFHLLQEFGANGNHQSESRVQLMQDESSKSVEIASSKGLKEPSCNSTPLPISNLAHEGNGSTTKPTNDEPLSGMNILVAEDLPFIRRLALATLSQLGANVKFAENGEIALSLVRQAFEDYRVKSKGDKVEGDSKHFLYDVILMDCEMPTMNGYEATRQIRIEEKIYGLQIPIIAITAHTSDEQGGKSIEAGMNLHLTKPFKPDQIVDAIRRISETIST